MAKEQVRRRWDGGGGGVGDGFDNGGHNQNEEFGKSSTPLRCCGIIGVIISGTLIIMGGAAMISTALGNNNAYGETVGTIIDLRSCGQICSGKDNNQCIETFGAKIRYTVDYTNYIINSTATCTNPGPIIGRDITVRYDPDNPQEAGDESWSALYLIPTILLSIGASLLCLVIVVCCINFRSDLFGDSVSAKFDGKKGLPVKGPTLNNKTLHPVGIQSVPLSSSPAASSDVKRMSWYSIKPPSESKRGSWYAIKPPSQNTVPPSQSTVLPNSNAPSSLQAFPISSNTDQSVQSDEPESIFDKLKQQSMRSIQ